MENKNNTHNFFICETMIILVIGFVLFLLPILSAQTFKQYDNTDLKIQCIINGSYCSSTAICNLTVLYPNSTILINNKLMQNQISFYNYTLPNTAFIGNYLCSTTCCDGVQCGTDNSCSYSINGIGSELTSAQSILYIVLLFGLFIVLIFTVWGAIIFPWKNPRTEEGNIVGINDLKYFKVVLWIAVYLEVLFFSLIFRNLAGGYLAIDGTYSFFNVIFNLLLVGMLPMFPLVIVFTIIIWISDKKTLKAISQGIPMS